MTKTLLINPPFNITKENYDSSVSVGLLSIATYLNSRGISVEMIDGARQKNYLDLIKEKIGDCNYAGISVMTTQIPAALKVSQLIREINPACKIIWGGPHPTFFIRQTIIHPLVDIVCYGEGELTMLDIARSIPLDETKGIAFKREGRPIINPPRELHDPAKMPLFNWDLAAKEILRKLYLIPSLTSRGCPHLCTFCINAISKNSWRPRTVEQILADLQAIKEREYFKGKKLRFWDENFFVDINRAREIIDEIDNKQNCEFGISWDTIRDYLYGYVGSSTSSKKE